MAITNAQQYQQLVNKPANGKRPGYRGSDMGTVSTSTREATNTQGSMDTSGADYGGGNQGGDTSGPDDRGSPIQNYNTGVATGRIDPNKVAPPPLTDRDKSFYRENPSKKPFQFPNFKTAVNKGLKFIGKSYYNRFPNNPEMEFRYIDQMSEDEYDDLPQSLKDAYEKTKTSPAIKSEKTYKDFDKLSFEDFSVLANDPKFKKYAYDRGSPGLFVSGDMSKVGDKFVKKDPITGETLRDPKTGQILYGYSPVRDGGGGGGAISDYERRLLELEQAVAAAAETPEVEEDQIINYRLMANGGRAGFAEGGMPYEGGIMDLETSRQMYGLGKFVKKITRGVKKIAKSPIGKAALGAALFKFGPGLLKGGGQGSIFSKLFGANNTMKGFANISTAKMPGFLSKIGLTQGYGSMMPTALGGILGSSALSYFMTPKEEDDNEELYAGADLPNPVEYYLSGQYTPNRRLAAEGGSMDEPEPVAKKTMPLLDMDGKEMDLRDEGGFVPLGRMERADDVPARLSKNEFVFTADAVRNAGEGDVDKGAEVMYNMMKNLESGGEVSEESQGLEGAREMFQTSQRLEEVI